MDFFPRQPVRNNNSFKVLSLTLVIFFYTRGLAMTGYSASLGDRKIVTRLILFYEKLFAPEAEFKNISHGLKIRVRMIVFCMQIGVGEAYRWVVRKKSITCLFMGFDSYTDKHKSAVTLNPEFQTGGMEPGRRWGEGNGCGSRGAE